MTERNTRMHSLHEEYMQQSAIEADEMVQFPCEHDQQKPVYYLKCTHFWSEFAQTAAFPYCINHVCDYQQEIPAESQEQADEMAAAANAAGFVCPICGSRGKLKGASQFEIYNDKRVLESINRSEINHG